MKKFGSESRLGDQIATLISTTSFGCLRTEASTNVIVAAAILFLQSRELGERITLQPEGSKAKGYQVRQIRAILLREQ